MVLSIIIIGVLNTILHQLTNSYLNISTLTVTDCFVSSLAVMIPAEADTSGILK